MTPEGKKKPVTTVLRNVPQLPEIVLETGNRAISKMSWCLTAQGFLYNLKESLLSCTATDAQNGFFRTALL